MSESPESNTPSPSFKDKLFSMPDWWLGLFLGGLVSALSLLLVIPQLNYGGVLQEPGEEELALLDRPLDPATERHAREARALLAKGRIGPAIAELKAVLAVRPSNLEARWLLANTYDRLGDEASALQQYRQFIRLAEQEQQVIATRITRARKRVELLTAEP